MVNREIFKKIISKLKEYQDNENSIYRAGVDLSGINEPLIESIFDLLKYSTNDITDLISYFCYELNFGEDWYEGCVTEEDGTDIRLQSIDDLYNVLVSDEERRDKSQESS